MTMMKFRKYYKMDVKESKEKNIWKSFNVYGKNSHKLD